MAPNSASWSMTWKHSCVVNSAEACAFGGRTSKKQCVQRSLQRYVSSQWTANRLRRLPHSPVNSLEYGLSEASPICVVMPMCIVPLSFAATSNRHRLHVEPLAHQRREIRMRLDNTSSNGTVASTVLRTRYFKPIEPGCAGVHSFWILPLILSADGTTRMVRKD